jgi:DNA transposition AAA+ family ATPase
MKREFVKGIKNVTRYVGAMEALWAREAGIEGLGLVMGEKGLGKTRTAIWYMANNDDAIYIRAKTNWKPSWMLRDINWELGLPPMRSVEELYGQIVNALREKPKLIMIDEINRCVGSEKLMETLRDVHDETATPLVFMGEVNVDHKIGKFAALQDRFNQVVRFARYDAEDIATIVRALLDVEITDDGLAAFTELVEKRFRPTVIALNRLEKWARANKMELLDGQHVKGVLKGRGATMATTRRHQRDARLAVADGKRA